MGTRSHELARTSLRPSTSIAPLRRWREHAWTTSWGSSTRMVGRANLVHGRRRRAARAAALAPTQVVVMASRLRITTPCTRSRNLRLPVSARRGRSATSRSAPRRRLGAQWCSATRRAWFPRGPRRQVGDLAALLFRGHSPVALASSAPRWSGCRPTSIRRARRCDGRTRQAHRRGVHCGDSGAASVTAVRSAWSRRRLARTRGEAGRIRGDGAPACNVRRWRAGQRHRVGPGRLRPRSYNGRRDSGGNGIGGVITSLTSAPILEGDAGRWA